MLYQFSLPDFVFIKQKHFDYNISALASSSTSIFVALNVRTANNQGLLLRLNADTFETEHQMQFQKEVHLIQVCGAYVGVAFNRTARLYLGVS